MLVALAAFAQSVRNGREARAAKAAALAAATVATANATETKQALTENTALTAEVADGVATVKKQTNGDRERTERRLDEAMAKIESMAKAIGILQGRQQALIEHKEP